MERAVADEIIDSSIISQLQRTSRTKNRKKTTTRDNSIAASWGLFKNTEVTPISVRMEMFQLT